MEAVKIVNRFAGIQLDGTCTEKTHAAIIDDAKQPNHSKDVILFWDTYNSRNISRIAKSIHYRQLPRRLHSYFENEVHAMNRK